MTWSLLALKAGDTITLALPGFFSDRPRIAIAFVDLDSDANTFGSDGEWLQGVDGYPGQGEALGQAHPTPYTLHSTPYTLNPESSTLHPSP